MRFLLFSVAVTRCFTFFSIQTSIQLKIQWCAYTCNQHTYNIVKRHSIWTCDCGESVPCLSHMLHWHSPLPFPRLCSLYLCLSFCCVLSFLSLSWVCFLFSVVLWNETITTDSSYPWYTYSIDMAEIHKTKNNRMFSLLYTRTYTI